MEIERKFLIDKVNINLHDYEFLNIEQGYLNAHPAIRIRRQNDKFFITYKNSVNDENMIREEYQFPITEEAYRHMVKKADGRIITKKRYLVPLTGSLTAEVDVFENDYSGLITAEVEFASETEARLFEPPWWFGKEVTNDIRYQNSYMAYY